MDIVIIDDEKLITDLLANYFKNDDEIIVKGVYNIGLKFIEDLRRSIISPEIILVDLKMEGLNGLDITEILKKEFPEIKIIVISSYYKASFMGFMLKSGVNAFIPKGISMDQLSNVIRKVYNKGFYFTEEHVEMMKNQISSKLLRPKFSQIDKLTSREMEVLKLICKQFTTQEIADELFVSIKTVEGHRSNLLLKSGVKNMAGLVIWSIQNELISVESFRHL